ncbi:MAG: hypothetical protein MI924_01715 [Chloroflexales bacterium]|nr:hypothetical protein [Chloroflexales bacterium]
MTRFHRRLHKLADWLACIATTVGELGLTGEVLVIARAPLPVCRRVRARHGKQVRGRVDGGYCAAVWRHSLQQWVGRGDHAGRNGRAAHSNPEYELRGVSCSL